MTEPTRNTTHTNRKPGDQERQRTPGQSSLFDYGQHASETRAIAAASALPKGPTRRDAIEIHVAACGEHGATRHEIAEALELPIQSVCGPVHSLLTSGRLRETEKRRLTQYGKPAAVIVSGLLTPEVRCE